MRNKAETLTLAFCIALLPPIWAVAAPYVGVTTGAVALICTGLCAANGDKAADAPRISAGFLLGDFWAWLALVVMDKMTLNPDFEVFITLFVMGKWIFCPAWLCGWAIGLTIMTPVGLAGIGTLPVQIGAAMLAGVWYVGVILNIVWDKLLCLWRQHHPAGKE